MAKRLFIIDAMAMAFRNFHAFGQRPLQTSSGQPTSAVYGSSQFMIKLIEDEKPDYLVVATDSPERKTFRHELYSAYKANRKDMPAELAAQLPDFFALFKAMNIPVLRDPSVEADDIIGSLAKKFAGPGLDCFIVSGDKDFMQLVSPSISIYAPKKSEQAQIVSYDEVFEKFGCSPEQVVDVLAIIGDTSDNVPGVHGIGEKGAAKLIQEYHSLDGIYQNLDNIANLRLRNALASAKEQAYLSQKLITIKTDFPIDVSLSDMELDPNKAVANEELLELFTKLEFRGLISKTHQKLHGSSPQASALLSMPAPKAAPAFAAPATVLNSSADSLATALDEISSQEKYGKSYLTANTPELLMRCAQELQGAEYFSFDTETTGLDRIADTVIGISVSTKPQTGWYIPLLQNHLEGWLTKDFILQTLSPIFLNSEKLKIAHNLKFDLQMFKNSGIAISGPFGDTMLQSYILNPYSKEHGLDLCAWEMLKFKKIPTSELMGTNFARSMAEVPLDQLATYACEDADIVLRLHNHYKPLLKEKNLDSVYETIEAPLAPILANMEQRGIYIDSTALADISMKLDQRAKELELIVYREAGEEFNMNSTKQLQTILFEKLKIHEKLGLTKLKKTKTGFSTDVTVLESLAEHPLPKAMLEYRLVSKLKSTYVDTLPQLIHPKTGRLHTHFHQTGTTTGRLSSSDPNLQNIPIRTAEGREIRKAFCASSPDRLLVSADYSQVELRILAHITGDEGLKDAFRSGLDIHTATAMKIFGLTKEQVTPDDRSHAKAINFGIIYGMGPQRLSRETGVSMAEAKGFIERYFAGFPGIRTYIENAKKSARDLGYSVTITGRRRPIPELQSRDRAVMVNGENMAVNSPIQGSAADLVKLAMIATEKELALRKMDAMLLLQVHDELVFECKASDAEELKAVVRKAMEEAMDLSVPIKVEVGSGFSWLEAH